MDTVQKVRNSKDEASSQGFEALKMEKDPESIKIYETLKENNIDPTKEMIQSIKGAFEKIPGTLNEKISTLNHLLKRNIELTPKNIKSVHHALHYAIDFDYVISKVLPEIEGYQRGLDEDGFEIQDHFKEEFFIANKPNDKDSILKNEKPFNHDIQVNESREEVIVESKEVVEKLEKMEPPLIESMLDDMGEKIEDLVLQINEQLLVSDKMENPVEAIDPSNFKAFIVTEVTQEMQQIKETFEVFKKKTINRLESLEHQSKPELMKANLQKVMKAFKDIILNSKITLYTSMSDEKRLIHMLSDLEEAESILNDGDVQKAKLTIKDLHSELKKIVFQPKDTKIKGFINKRFEELLTGKTSVHKQLKNVLTEENKGSRNILENLRLTGVNHEAEVVHALEGEDLPKMPVESLKSILMSFNSSKDFAAKGEIQESIDHLTGQQLLNKSNVKSEVQSLNLSIPYMAEDKIKSLDLYIHTKKKNEVLDWKNTTIYFVMDLKQYGETGIKIQSINKRLFMTVKNDSQDFKKKSYKAFNQLLEDLTDVGYTKGRLKYTRLSDSNNRIQKEIKEKGFVIERKKEEGFDIKI